MLDESNARTLLIRRLHTHKKHIDIHSSSGNRTQDPIIGANKDNLCHRPLGHSDEHHFDVHFLTQISLGFKFRSSPLRNFGLEPLLGLSETCLCTMSAFVAKRIGILDYHEFLILFVGAMIYLKRSLYLLITLLRNLYSVIINTILIVFSTELVRSRKQRLRP
jgi:hypothetical protein